MKQVQLVLREHLSWPSDFWWVLVAHLFSFLRCSIMCLHVLTSVLWCPLLFPHDVRFVFTLSCSHPVFGVACCPFFVYFSVLCISLRLSLFCVFCTQCCLYLWIVHSWFSLRVTLIFIVCLDNLTFFVCRFK